MRVSLRDGISDFIKGTPGPPSPLPPREDTGPRWLSLNQEGGSPRWRLSQPLDLGLVSRLGS